jgi:hypothetical protein
MLYAEDMFFLTKKKKKRKKAGIKTKKGKQKK